MRKGFTLIEVLLALSSGLMIVGVVTFLYISAAKNWDTLFAQNQINNNFTLISNNLAKQFIENKVHDPELSGFPYQEKILSEELYVGTIRFVSISVSIPSPSPNNEIYTYHQIFRSRS